MIPHLQSEKVDHPNSIEFEFEAILSVQTVFILKSNYYTIMLLGAYTVESIINTRTLKKHCALVSRTCTEVQQTQELQDRWANV